MYRRPRLGCSLPPFKRPCRYFRRVAATASMLASLSARVEAMLGFTRHSGLNPARGPFGLVLPVMKQVKRDGSRGGSGGAAGEGAVRLAASAPVRSVCPGYGAALLAWPHRCFLLVAFSLVAHVASGLFTKWALGADGLQLG